MPHRYYPNRPYFAKYPQPFRQPISQNSESETDRDISEELQNLHTRISHLETHPLAKRRTDQGNSSSVTSAAPAPAASRIPGRHSPLADGRQIAG